MEKKYDLVVKIGTYANRYGEEKGRYENIGSVMEGDNGPFAILKRTFNPAGVPNPDSRDSVLVSMFEPRDFGDKPRQPAQSAPQQQPPQSASFDDVDSDDDIPF